MHSLRAICSLFLISALLFSCASVDSDDPDFAKGDRWIDSDLIGSISQEDEILPTDDFAASANKEWILTDGADLNGRNADHIADIVLQKKIDLLSDDSLTGKDAQELKKYASLAGDWDARSKSGVEPLRQYLSYIESIDTVEKMYEWITDSEKNPLGLAPVIVSVTISPLRAYPDELMVIYEEPSFSLSSEAYYNILGGALESKEITDQKVTYLMTRLGYDNAYIKKLLTADYAIEKKLSDLVSPVPTDDDAELALTDAYADIISAAGEYPLEKYMTNRGYTNIKHMVGDIKYLKKVSRVCTNSLG